MCTYLNMPVAAAPVYCEGQRDDSHWPSTRWSFQWGNSWTSEEVLRTSCFLIRRRSHLYHPQPQWSSRGDKTSRTWPVCRAEGWLFKEHPQPAVTPWSHLGFGRPGEFLHCPATSVLARLRFSCGDLPCTYPSGNPLSQPMFPWIGTTPGDGEADSEQSGTSD